MKVEILPVTEADIENIAALARIIWQDTYVGIITQSQIDYMLEQRYSARQMSEELKLPTVWWNKLLLDGELVAFTSMQATRIPGEVKLDKIYVHPEKQHLGLGGQLIGHVCASALQNNSHSIILAVNKQNEQAIKAYKKYGFTVREAVRVDIGNGFIMDDFIMEKPLN